MGIVSYKVQKFTENADIFYITTKKIFLFKRYHEKFFFTPLITNVNSFCLIFVFVSRKDVDMNALTSLVYELGNNENETIRVYTCLVFCTVLSDGLVSSSRDVSFIT